MEAIQVQVKDGRKKVRSLSITGFIKPSGRIVAKVTNDQGKEYFVDGDKCHKCPSRGKCYHRQAVAQVAHLLPSCQEVEYDVVAEATQVAAEADRLHSIEEVVEYASSLMQQIERDSAEDAYAELGETKKVSVPPAEYDSCKQCGCRTAVGAGYCKRC